jgi:EAL domain-containing protein (putative c-di-GMP-specific phosphodiesterase class I)
LATDKFRRTLKSGETLFHQGDPGDCAYAIETGQLEVFRGRGKSRKVLALLGPGEVVGEMAVIDHLPRTASAVARKATRLRVITQDHLQGKLDAADPLVRVLLRVVLKRYRTAVAGKRGQRSRAGEDDKAALARNRLIQDLEIALEQEQFYLHYQPIVRLDDMSITGFEALVRWNHPKRGRVAPNDFIPLLEESGMIQRFGNWVLRAACAAIRRLNYRPHAADLPLFVCVNLSGRELASPELVSRLGDVLAETRIPPQALRIEITESALVSNLDSAVQVITRCRELGVQVAVDDFGTGYSSLNYLRHFTVDTLKIDRSFVKPVHTDEDNRQILRTIRDLAHALDMNIVTEGIEDLGQARMVKELGLELAQGFLFSRPVAEDEAAAMLAKPWPWSFERRLVLPGQQQRASVTKL